MNRFKFGILVLAMFSPLAFINKCSAQVYKSHIGIGLSNSLAKDSKLTANTGWFIGARSSAFLSESTAIQADINFLYQRAKINGKRTNLSTVNIGFTGNRYFGGFHIGAGAGVGLLVDNNILDKEMRSLNDPGRALLIIKTGYEFGRFTLSTHYDFTLNKQYPYKNNIQIGTYYLIK